MNLRYRLFLWVGSLFLIGFCFSFFWEGYIVRKNLALAENNLRKEILALNEKKREGITQFLKLLLANYKAHVDSLLQHLHDYEQLEAKFASDAYTMQRGTWYPAVSLLMVNHTIDFLQNTSEGKLFSLVTLNSLSKMPSRLIPIDRDLGWIFLNERKAYLGARFPFQLNLEFLDFIHQGQIHSDLNVYTCANSIGEN